MDLVKHTEVADFRSRTAEARRVKTRLRILEAAFDLFDQRGVDKVTVEDVRHAAKLSRGTFYNYFATYEAMLLSIAADISAQINREQSEFFDALPDLTLRLSLNMRYFITRIVSDRSCGEILLRAGPLVGALNEGMRRHVEAEIADAALQGVIEVPSIPVAIEFGYSIGTAMIRRAIGPAADANDIEYASLMMLRAFGVGEAKASRAANAPLPAMPKATLRELIFSRQERRSRDDRNPAAADLDLRAAPPTPEARGRARKAPVRSVVAKAKRI